MLQFSPLLLLQCMFLLSSVTVDGSSVMTGVMMCKRWCERRSWCSEATYDSHSLQCSTEKKTPRLPGLTVIHVQQHLCDPCPQHHVCLRTRTGAIKCVKEDTTNVIIKDRIRRHWKLPSWGDILKRPGNERRRWPGRRRSKTLGQKTPSSRKQSAGNSKEKCRGTIRYVELRRPVIKTDAVYYSIFAPCPKDEKLKVFRHLTGTFGIMSFEEPKKYYWVMTLEKDMTWSQHDSKSISFQVAVTNQNQAASSHLKHAEVFKGFTVSVDRKRITFKSLKNRTRQERRGSGRYVVVLDKIKGRMFLGTQNVCYAMEDGIDIGYKLYPVVIYPRGHSPTETKLLFDSIRGGKYKFTYEDVETMTRRCVKDF